MALFDADDLKRWMGMSDDQLLVDVIRVYNDVSEGNVSAMVKLVGNTLTLDWNDGVASTKAFDLTAAAYDTLEELVTGIVAEGDGWNAEALLDGEFTSEDLSDVGQFNTLGIGNAITLQGIDNTRISAAITRALADAEWFCDRVFEEAEYLEMVDGDGGSELWLRHRPLQRLEFVADGTVDVMKVKNAASGAARAHASIHVLAARNWEVLAPAMALRLVVQGGDDPATDSLTVANYADVDAIVAAVIAQGRGWTAEAVSGYGSFPYTLLVPSAAAQPCLNTWATFGVPSDPMSDVRVANERTSKIVRGSGFPVGNGNLYVEYYAGYSATTMPANLTAAIMSMGSYLFRNGPRDLSLKSERLGDYQWTAATGEEGTQDEYMSLMSAGLAPFRSWRMR